MGVVIVIDVDHQGAQQIAHLVRNLSLKSSEFTRFNVLSDVVVGKERHPSCLKPLADPAGHLGTETRLAVAVGLAGAVGHERDGGGHGYSFRRRRQPA